MTNVRLISFTSCLAYVSSDIAPYAFSVRTLGRQLDDFYEGKGLLPILVTHSRLCSGVDGRLQPGPRAVLPCSRGYGLKEHLKGGGQNSICHRRRHACGILLAVYFLGLIIRSHGR